jgi:hypothetical protein
MVLSALETRSAMIERDLKLLRVGDRANTLKVSGHADFVKEYDPAPPPLPRTVDCASAASPSYTVVDLGDDSDDFLNTAKCPTAHGVTDLMLEQVLPYVTLDGKAVSKDQCFLWGLSYNTTTGPLLPIMHRDGQWSAFGESAGFQVWALCANSDETGKGNMMMVEHDEPEQARRSSAYFVTDEDGVVLIPRLTQCPPSHGDRRAQSPLTAWHCVHCRCSNSTTRLESTSPHGLVPRAPHRRH